MQNLENSANTILHCCDLGMVAMLASTQRHCILQNWNICFPKPVPTDHYKLMIIYNFLETLTNTLFLIFLIY